MIPPTPESDITASPQSPRHISDPTNSNSPDHQPLVSQKRKAGRKPLYKTAQERRDRNRRAQLAFRARRSDYLARLEDTCRSLEHVVVELQESNRAANDALARERSKVKYLESMIRNSQRSVSAFPSNPAITIPTADNDSLSASAEQRVSFPLFPQEHSLITLEQQFSPPTSTSQISQSFHTPNKVVFGENYLGMLPLPVL